MITLKMRESTIVKQYKPAVIENRIGFSLANKTITPKAALTINKITLLIKLTFVLSLRYITTCIKPKSKKTVNNNPGAASKLPSLTLTTIKIEKVTTATASIVLATVRISLKIEKRGYRYVEMG